VGVVFIFVFEVKNKKFGFIKKSNIIKTKKEFVGSSKLKKRQRINKFIKKIL